MDPHTTPRHRPRAGLRMVLGLVTFAFIVWSSALPTRGLPTLPACLASTAIAGAGTILVALILMGGSPSRRRTGIGAACVLAAMMMLTPFTAGSPAAWRHDVGPLLWMVPWFPLATMATGGGWRGRARAGVCAIDADTDRSWAIGVALVLGAILLAVGPVGRLLFGHH